MARGAVGTIWSPPAVAEMIVRLVVGVFGGVNEKVVSERKRRRKKRNEKKNPSLEKKKKLTSLPASAPSSPA